MTTATGPEPPEPPGLRWLVPGLLATASVSLFLGLFLPFFHVRKFWIFEDAVSAVGGILSLFDAGEYFLFVVIGVFTIIFPISKIVLLSLIWMDRRLKSDRVRRLQIWVSHLGKWSMLDVFVVAVLLVMIRAATGMADMTVGVGLYLFTAAIMINQVASSIVDRILRVDEPQPGRRRSSRPE